MEVLKKPVIHETKPITIKEVDTILTDMDKEEARIKDQIEIEEFLDIEKERLNTEANNWRRTAQDLDLDLKSAQRSNEKLIKDQISMQEDYHKVSKAAGALQSRVHILEEEVSEMKLKMELDIKAKDKAEIALEVLKAELDNEGIPKCPICSKWFPNTEAIKGHMDIQHDGKRNSKISQPSTTSNASVSEEMENSDQTGYGTTKEYQLVAVQCKKCDETLDNNHLLRIHMRKHVRKESEILKCINCEYESKEENAYLNHIVDNHSTVHICQTCDKRFSAKDELIMHMGTDHGLNQNKIPDLAQGVDINTIKCFSCGTMLQSREALMKHKKDKHWKEKKCAYYHGIGQDCRFPDHIGFNIHRMEEQQEFRGQVQGAGGQVQGAGGRVQGSGGQMQGAGGRVQGPIGQMQGPSWAGVAGGQGVRGQRQDARKNIDCRDGIHCRYYSQGECRYRHNYSTTQNSQYNNSQSSHDSENKTNESSFNMEEMKLTIENLAKVVYNLKSMADFPRVNQSETTQ